MTQADDEDLVARRLIMRREVWDQCVAISETAQALGQNLSATDVATLALIEGLSAVHKTAGVPEKKAARKKRAAKPPG